MGLLDEVARLKRGVVLTPPAPNLKLLLAEAVCVIEGLSEQQAIYDAFYEEDLIRFKEALGWPVEPMPPSWFADRLAELRLEEDS